MRIFHHYDVFWGHVLYVLYKPGKGYHEDVIKHAEPVYLKLTDEKELSKCLHRKTKNANESFNSLIWERAPKSKYCGLKKLKLGVYDAIGYFNYRGQSIIDTLKLLNISNAGMMIAERKYNAA